MLSLRGAVRVFSALSLPQAIVVRCSLWGRWGEQTKENVTANLHPSDHWPRCFNNRLRIFFTSRCTFHLSRTKKVWKSGKEPPPEPLTLSSICARPFFDTWTTRMLLIPNRSVHLRILLCIRGGLLTGEKERLFSQLESCWSDQTLGNWRSFYRDWRDLDCGSLDAAFILRNFHFIPSSKY